DGGLEKSGDEMADRLVETDLPLLHQLQHGGAGDRLGLRSDAEDGVGGHFAARFLIAPADGALVHGLAVAQNEADRSGEAALIDVVVEEMVEARYPVGREAAGLREGGGG